MKHITSIPSTIVGAVLLLVTVVSPALYAGPSGAPSIAEIVVQNPDIDGDGQGDFNILLAAVQAADSSVLNRLAAKGQNTVFAPTDAAFEAAFEELETLGISPEDLLANTELLTLILNYHISPGKRESTNVLKAKKVRMRDGGFLQQQGGILTDNLEREAGIIVADIRASNGVIHVIDNVVLPALP